MIKKILELLKFIIIAGIVGFILFKVGFLDIMGIKAFAVALIFGYIFSFFVKIIRCKMKKST